MNSPVFFCKRLFLTQQVSNYTELKKRATILRQLATNIPPPSRPQWLKGKAVSYLPKTAFITVIDEQKQEHYYTLLRNSAHSNVSELFKEDSRGLPDEDTLTLAPAF